MVNESNSVDISQVQHLAAAGHFRMLALWVNQMLVPQGIYAQVQADRRPGCLQVLLEFKRPPQPEATIRLVCHRLWHLNSSIIEGANIIARPIGQSRTLWQRRVKILTPQQRLQKRQKHSQKQQQHPISAAQQAGNPPQSSPGKAAGRPPGKSPWNISLSKKAAVNPANHSPKPAEPAAKASEPSKTGETQPITQGPAIIRPNAEIKALATLEAQSTEDTNRRAQRRRRALRRSRKPLQKSHLQQHFKYVRAAVVTGSAAAAFILGCLTEVVISGNGPALPHWGGTLPGA